MKYKIVEKEGFEIVGKGIRVSTGNGENFKRIPKFWEECNENSLCSNRANARCNSGHAL